MEGQIDYENYLKLMSLDFGLNHNILPPLNEYDSNQHFLPVVGMNENHSDAHSQLPWTYDQHASHNYIKFMAESSTYDHKSSFSGIPEKIPLPCFGVQSEVLNKNKGKAHNIERAGSSNIDMVSSWSAMPSLHIPSRNNHVDSINGAGLYNSSVINTTRKDQVNKHDYHALKSHSEGKVAPKQRYKNHYSKQRTTETDRLRRVKIAERLKKLQELLPNSKEVSQASMMNDVIQYVTHLQLQLKELTRSGLGTESTSNPFISLERYGQKPINEQKKKEALEEMIGDMLVMNPSEATQLLESRGLMFTPISLTEDLLNMLI